MKSHVIRMPDFNMIKIPEKQRTIMIKDQQIFHEIKTRFRRIEDCDEGAVKGDYVLIDARYLEDSHKRRNIELGGKAFRDLQKYLTGRKKGEKIRASVSGKELDIEILSVRKVEEPVLTDSFIAQLNIPNVSTLAEYRKMYIDENGVKIADRVFRSIQKNIMDQAVSLSEMYLDQEEIDEYDKRQRVMLQNISGNIDERLQKAYGDNGTKTLEECYQKFYEDNKRNFKFWIFGRELAIQNKFEPSKEEYERAREFYCLAYAVTAEQTKREEVLRSVYIQYGVEKLREYYMSLVNFKAEGIPAYPIGADA